jgi:uncharacterized protein YndB with AHSA1/START domain
MNIEMNMSGHEIARGLIATEYGVKVNRGHDEMSAAMHVEVLGTDSVFMRVIAAPRALVFKAWINPKQLARWCGPLLMTCLVCEGDLRTGGWYRLVMRSPDGVDYRLAGIYREIVAPERIVGTVDTRKFSPVWHDMLKQYCNGEPATEMLWAVSFEEQDGNTKLTIRTNFASLADRDAFMKMGMSDGLSQSLDRLEKLAVTALIEQTSCGIRSGAVEFFSPS